MGWFTQVVGVGLVLLALIDIFLTVLYPRSHVGVLSAPFSRRVWRLFQLAANITHELSHAILLHPPSELFSEHGCRNYNKELKEEAEWLGSALLVSEEAALHIVKVKMSLSEATELYNASGQVVSMRINVTAARKRIASL